MILITLHFCNGYLFVDYFDLCYMIKYIKRKCELQIKKNEALDPTGS